MIGSFKISAPASIGNFILGFDHIGAAVDWVSDEIIVRPNQSHSELRITKIIGDNNNLSKLLDTNVVGVAAQNLLQHLGQQLPFGIDLELKKCIGIGTGLGSSASSATAAVMAINEVFKRPLEKRALLHFANLGEKLASGCIHADNTAPALLGGIQLVLSDNPDQAHRLACPKGLHVVLSYPHVTVRTCDARNALLDTVLLKEHAAQNSRTAAMILALERSDFALLRRCLDDQIIEPQRAHLIPGYEKIKQIHRVNETMGSSISGSGPAMVGLYDNSIAAERAVENIRKYYEDQKIKSSVNLCRINTEGTVKC